MVTHKWGSEMIDPRGRDLPSLKFRYLLQEIKKKNCKVLEIGSGNGKNLRSIRALKPDVQCYGCDVKKPTVKPKFNFKLLDGNMLPYPSEYFDVVLMVDVLEHVKKYKEYVKEIKRVLKKGGLFIGFVPIEGNAISTYTLSKLFFGDDVFLKTKEHINSFRTDQVLDLLEKNFTVRKIRYSYHLLGQTMDTILFTSLLNKRMEKLFWDKNKYYNTKQDAKKGIAARIFNTALSMANMAAYAEARLLKKVKLFAAGIHFTCVKEE